MSSPAFGQVTKCDVDDSGGTPRDISLDVTDINMPINVDQSDVTGYLDGVHNVKLCHTNQPVTMSGVFNNTADTGSHIVLSGIVGFQTTTCTVTVQVGIKAVPAGGDPEYEGEFYCTDYVVNGDLTWNATWLPATTTAPAWGTV